MIKKKAFLMLMINLLNLRIQDNTFHVSFGLISHSQMGNTRVISLVIPTFLLVFFFYLICLTQYWGQDCRAETPWRILIFTEKHEIFPDISFIWVIKARVSSGRQHILLYSNLFFCINVAIAEVPQALIETHVMTDPGFWSYWQQSRWLHQTMVKCFLRVNIATKKRDINTTQCSWCLPKLLTINCREPSQWISKKL